MRTPPYALALLALLAIACAAPRAEVAAPPAASAPQVAPARPVGPAPPPAGEENGSTRNSRVALPDASKEPELLWIGGRLTPERLEELARIAPKLRVVTEPTPEQLLALAPQARAIDARYATDEFLARAPKLVWIQAMSAGVERLVSRPSIAGNDRIVLTNQRGASGPAIADHAFAMLLALTRNLRNEFEAQAAAHWSREDAATRPIALAGRTMLVVGLGGIGGEVAQRAHGFGMKVVATRRSDAPGPDWLDHVGRPEELLTLLPQADVVAICVPLTKETEHLFDEKAFAAMKPGSYLVNVARGKIVATAALVKSLESGRLAGACLDVTDPEPLPKESPLWAMKNVVITPHVASDAEITDARAWDLLQENLRRFAAGEGLLNVVDKSAGY
jgi:phosphoglycerate dehydrogenase-like enzyme